RPDLRVPLAVPGRARRRRPVAHRPDHLDLREGHPRPVLPGTRLAVDPDELARYRPAYRFLTWYLNRKGNTVGDHHLGDDRPEPVAAQYRAEHAWPDQNPTSATSATL